jgi:hypothetical protein
VEKEIILNRIKTPDGTILTSYYVHDYRKHIDKNGEEYIVDGGTYYLKRSNNIIPYEELSVYSDAPFEIIRESLHWGTYGKEADQPLHWVALKDMSTEHIINCLRTQKIHWEEFFRKELEYRTNTKIGK